MQTSNWSDDKTLSLPDGRVIGFRCRGKASGKPLFFMHGTPGSRFVLADNDLLCQLPGLFIILAERPGYGLSSAQADRSLLSWADDIQALAQHLGLQKYWVAGISGGAPHALACAYVYPQHVQAAYLLSSPAPQELLSQQTGMALGNRIASFLIRRWPALYRWFSAAAATACQRDALAYLQKIRPQMAKADQQLMSAPALLAAMAADLQAAYQQGHQGAFDDAVALTARASWGISYHAIQVPVLLWHGADDTLAPASMAQALHAAIPGSALQILTGKGHLLTEEHSVVQAMAEHIAASAMPAIAAPETPIPTQSAVSTPETETA